MSAVLIGRGALYDAVRAWLQVDPVRMALACNSVARQDALGVEMSQDLTDAGELPAVGPCGCCNIVAVTLRLVPAADGRYDVVLSAIGRKQGVTLQ